MTYFAECFAVRREFGDKRLAWPEGLAGAYSRVVMLTSPLLVATADRLVWRKTLDGRPWLGAVLL